MFRAAFSRACVLFQSGAFSGVGCRATPAASALSPRPRETQDDRSARPLCRIRGPPSRSAVSLCLARRSIGEPHSTDNSDEPVEWAVGRLRSVSRRVDTRRRNRDAFNARACDPSNAPRIALVSLSVALSQVHR